MHTYIQARPGAGVVVEVDPQVQEALARAETEAAMLQDQLRTVSSTYMHVKIVCQNVCVFMHLCVYVYVYV